MLAKCLPYHLHCWRRLAMIKKSIVRIFFGVWERGNIFFWHDNWLAIGLLWSYCPNFNQSLIQLVKYLWQEG